VKALPRIVDVEVEGDFDLSPAVHRVAAVPSGSGVSGSDAAIRWSSLSSPITIPRCFQASDAYRQQTSRYEGDPEPWQKRNSSELNPT